MRVVVHAYAVNGRAHRGNHRNQEAGRVAGGAPQQGCRGQKVKTGIATGQSEAPPQKQLNRGESWIASTDSGRVGA